MGLSLIGDAAFAGVVKGARALKIPIIWQKQEHKPVKI